MVVIKPTHISAVQLETDGVAHTPQAKNAECFTIGFHLTSNE